MLADTRAWLTGLLDFASERRRDTPLPDLGQPSVAQAAERSIIAANLVTSLADLDALLAARAAWLRTAGAMTGDVDPAIVLTTSPVGIVAAGEVLGPGAPLTALAGPRLAVVSEPEYRLWCIRSPDDAFRLHVNLWNWLKTAVPAQRWPEFAAHPLADGERYWLHRAGVAGAGPADRRDCHLWRWNGRHAALLQPFIREAVASRPGASRQD
ncbi:MAG: hypothetical protein EBR23_03705 [Planctomycetia bacterium]|nr:hypothetical protein [Planctomycetia bacterium]